ncbi:hypothetical protein [Actinomycetospora endophytica]|uniref:hypothetical protein n=1 Tax=Actinomycetospora endophytica TaxID=2291215 RepID=UPI0027E30A82|nr:hypothetical protein [Actinomycetospora endophytica]
MTTTAPRPGQENGTVQGRPVPPARHHKDKRTWVGKSIRRLEDPKFLRGRGGYIGDMVLPGMLHAAVLRSPMAHARIAAIDTATAERAPGVHAVITGARAAELLDPLPDFGPNPRRTCGGLSPWTRSATPVRASRSRSPTTATSPRTPSTSSRWSTSR